MFRILRNCFLIRVIFILLLILLMKSDYVQEYYVFTKIYNTPNIKQLIKKYSKIYNLDESLVLAFCDLESEFNPEMINPKSSSQGLFGLINSTYKFVADMEHIERDGNYKDLPIEEQIYLATRYIKYLCDKYNYNAYELTTELGTLIIDNKGKISTIINKTI